MTASELGYGLMWRLGQFQDPGEYIASALGGIIVFDYDAMFNVRPAS